MTDQRHTIQLKGCTPTPLAHYLKALGILRLVSEQVDPTAQGYWKEGTFWLNSILDEELLETFFLNVYSPTPIVAPWNGGSGFYPKDNQTAVKNILNGKTDRLANYQETINICHEIIDSLGLTQKPDTKGGQKENLLLACRNYLPDVAVRWLDAAYLLTDDGVKFPPLLGTGGNDGRLEFTNNFMQRLGELFSAETGEPLQRSDDILKEALYNDLQNIHIKSVIGQFDPGSAGGANATTGYDSDSLVNIWSYVLMLEGALGFSAVASKKLEQSQFGGLAYPFCVRTTGTDYGSASPSDEQESRNEMWLPLWDKKSTYVEVAAIFGEGRVEVRAKSSGTFKSRQAKTGLDFARAISSLGVASGIDSFIRYSFQVRNGLSYFAIPLGFFRVHNNSTIEKLIGSIDIWLGQFRRVATDKTTPASAGRALRRLERAIFNLCKKSNPSSSDQPGNPESVRQVLIALGEAEATIARSPKLREAVPPIPLLPLDWLKHTYRGNDDTEFRLAASLASIGYNDEVGPLRKHVEPVDFTHNKGVQWKKKEFANDPTIVWDGSDLIQNLINVIKRRMIEATQKSRSKSEKEDSGEELLKKQRALSINENNNDGLFPCKSEVNANLDDIARFIQGGADFELLESLLRGFLLLDWRNQKKCREILNELFSHHKNNAHLKNLRLAPDASYALLKLCYLGVDLPYFDVDGSEDKPPSNKEKGEHIKSNQEAAKGQKKTNKVPLAPMIFRRALSGDLGKATQLAARRLRGSGFSPTIETIYGENAKARRIAASLLFPLGKERNYASIRVLQRLVVPDDVTDGEAPVTNNE
ncbi:MAG: type I-U CRISPR-associated protein Csx17 [Pirellulaceae bacterium]|nr:type I-U CRISPR-associated protein Csx17 [Pirellulaceae bacterium]